MSAHAATVALASGGSQRLGCLKVWGGADDLVARQAEDRRVAKILYAYFIAEKRRNAKTTAAEMRVSYKTFDAWCTGRQPLPRSRVPALLAATRDPDLAAELLGFDSLGWTIVPRPRADSSTDVRSEAIGAASAAAELATTIDSALRPDSEGGEHVTETELQRVRAAREHAARDVETASRAVEMRVRR